MTMYLEHFGLREAPFRITPHTEFFFSGANRGATLEALMYAITAITVQLLARTDSTQAMMVWVMVMMAAGSALLAWPHWIAIAAADLPVICGIGVAGALGQYAITEAFRLGEASLMAPLEYTALVWGVLPDAITWAGAAIIIASGLYLLHRERLQASVPDPQPPG